MLFSSPELAIYASALPIPPALMFIIGPVWIAFILFILRYLSGWSALVRVYRAPGPFAGKLNRFCSGFLNSVHFNNSLILGADESGLYFGSLFPFSLAFPPLLIPWEDITASPMKVFWSTYVDFRFRQVPSVVFRVPESLGRKLLFFHPITSAVN